MKSRATAQVPRESKATLGVPVEKDFCSSALFWKETFPSIEMKGIALIMIEDRRYWSSLTLSKPLYSLNLL